MQHCSGLAPRIVMDKESLIALAKQKAVEHGLDPALVEAVCEQESNWCPWATRYEPDFMRRYVGPLYTKGGMTATEAYTRSMSFGLMQVLGQVAREQGFEGQFLAELCDPATGLDQGCKRLLSAVERHPTDVGAALLAYNGGARPEYASEVLSRLPGYSETPSAPPVETATSQSPRTVPIDHPAA
jgi:soluble lytic murein transglycosylase-like protein